MHRVTPSSGTAPPVADVNDRFMASFRVECRSPPYGFDFDRCRQNRPSSTLRCSRTRQSWLKCAEIDQSRGREEEVMAILIQPLHSTLLSDVEGEQFPPVETGDGRDFGVS